jgi:exonuclease III
MKCDIAYFQETHFDQNIENEINFNTDFNVYGSIGTSASRGVAIFINKAVNYKVIDKVTDENGRIVLLNVQIDDAVFSLVCIYAPNSKTLRNMFFKKVSNFCKEHGTGILVVGGDFNEIMPLFPFQTPLTERLKPHFDETVVCFHYISSRHQLTY